MSTHQATVPKIAVAYFQRGSNPTGEHPIITAEYHADRGRWVSVRHYRKRVSGAWCRKLGKQGVTHVALCAGGRTADFAIRELIRH